MTQWGQGWAPNNTKLNDVNPQAWLADVLARIAEQPQTRLYELLPWYWKPERQQPLAA